MKVKQDNGFILLTRNGISSKDQVETTGPPITEANTKCLLASLIDSDDVQHPLLPQIDALSYSALDETDCSLLVLYQHRNQNVVNLNPDIISKILDYCTSDTLQTCRLCCSDLYRLVSFKLFNNHPSRRRSYLKFLDQFKTDEDQSVGEIDEGYLKAISMTSSFKRLESFLYLKNLVITRSYQSMLLNDKLLSEIFKKCKRLRLVELKSINELKDFGRLDQCIKILFENCKALRTLKLSQCDLLSDDAFILDKTGNSALTLEEIEFIECRNVTTAGILALIKSCPELKNVTLTHSKKIMGDSVIKLLSMDKMEQVSISHCGKIDDTHILKTLQGSITVSSRLKSISLISNFGIISKEVFIQFLKFLAICCKDLSKITIVLPMNIANNGISFRPELLSEEDLNRLKDSKNGKKLVTIVQSE